MFKSGCSLLFKRFYLLIFGERRKEGDREGKKHQCVVTSHMPPNGDVALNPDMCPDWKSNWQPFGLKADAQPVIP